MAVPLNVQQMLDVFKYACTHNSTSIRWDKTAIQGIEKTLLRDPKLERLYALIYQNASARKQLDYFDVTTQALLKKTTYATVADIAVKRSFIQQLVPLLEDNGISIILLKGMAFNDDLYPAFAPRGTSDIDILIKPDDNEKFTLMLAELARPVAVDSDQPFDGLYEKSWVVKASANQFIDVHTHLTNPLLFEIDSTALWQTSAVHCAYQSENVRVMNDENTCAYLLTHMINDTNFYHYNLIDLHEIVAKGQLSALKLKSVVKEWGVSKAYCYVQQIGKKHLLTDTNLQAGFFHSNRQMTGLRWFFINRVMLIDTQEKSVLQRVQQLLTYFLFVDSTQNVVKVIKKYLITRFS